MINFYANRSFFCLSGAKARYPACDLILVVIWALPSEFYRPDSVFRIDFVIYSLKGVQYMEVKEYMEEGQYMEYKH